MDEPSPSATKPQPKKSSVAKKLLLVVGLIALLGMFGVGAVFGPRFLPHTAAAGESPKDKEKDKEEPAESVAQLEPIVIDLRESNGDMHHLKVGIAIELVTVMHGEEFKRYEPRARDAAITFLRTLTFDEVTNPTQLERIRTQLGERVATAVGKRHVRKVLFTDYVTQ